MQKYIKKNKGIKNLTDDDIKNFISSCEKYDKNFQILQENNTLYF
jgi:hypothetical protein